MKKRQYPTLDIFRIVAAFFVVAIHTSVLSSFSENADFFLTGILCRTAVPFFFMVSGFFVMPQIAKHFYTIIQTQKKLGILYVAAILLYLPLNIYAGQYFFQNVPCFLRAVFLDGTFYHLWYFPAIMEGMLLLSLLQCFCSKKICFFICLILYLIGMGGDSYYGITAKVPVFYSFYEAYFHIGTYTRNGIFFAPVFLCMGWILSDFRFHLSLKKSKIVFLISFGLLALEAGLLHFFSVCRHNAMYLFLLPCMYGLFCLLLSLPYSRQCVHLRKISMIIYLIHPWVIVLVRVLAQFLHLEAIFIQQSLFHFGAVASISYGLAVILWNLQKKIQKWHFVAGQR